MPKRRFTHRCQASRFSSLTAPLAVLIVMVGACEQDRSLAGTAPPDAARSGGVHADLSEAPAVGAPLPFLSFAQQAAFARGAAVFQRAFTPATGLGPLFNGSSCGECHEDPVLGGAGDEVETHASAFHGAGACDDLAAVGGPVIQDSATPALAARGIEKEPLPAAVTATGRRATASIRGFGLLDAVPDWEILAHADPHDRNHDGIAGRPNRLADGRIGRFGRKAQEPTLAGFVSGAFLNEMGITDPAHPRDKDPGGVPLPPGVDPSADPELSAQDLAATQAFVRFLAPPSREPLNLVTLAGSVVFAKIGCAACHVPALFTGYDRVNALSFKVVYAHTDLLLHDMGPDLADICLGGAGPSDFRTAPLIGLRFAHGFMHDGRAATIEQSILLHAGEGARSRDRFVRLSSFERGALLRFVGSL